jgi:hypothetical protein
MKILLAVTAACEAALGLALLVYPAIVIHAILIILLLRARSRERMSGVGEISDTRCGMRDSR